MKNILLFISIFFFQISFSQVITFECNNSIITVSWEEIVNNPNAYMDWDADGISMKMMLQCIYMKHMIVKTL